MSNWNTIPIKQVYSGMFDGPHATPKPTDSGPTFLGIKNVKESGGLDLSEIRHISEDEFPNWIRRVQPRHGDIVFSYEATLNRYAIIPKDFRGCLGRRMALIRPDESKVCGRFLYYYFFGRDWRNTITQNTLMGSTVNRIPIAKFPDFLITIPPLPTQNKIASILSNYDELIENNTRRIKILEEMAQSIYREWFVNYRFPGHEKVKMVESPLGMIPEGWEVRKIGDVATIFRGRSYRTTDLVDEGGLPFLNLKCIERDGGFRRDGIKRYIGNYSEGHVARKGDIVVAVTDMTQDRRIVARAALVPTLDKDHGVCSMDLVRLEPSSEVLKTFLYFYLRFSSFPDIIKQHANGVNVLHLSPDRIRDHLIPLPSEEIISNFAQHGIAYSGLIDVLENHKSILRQTRDLLLPRLISGEIDVTDLDIQVPEELLQ